MTESLSPRSVTRPPEPSETTRPELRDYQHGFIGDLRGTLARLGARDRRIVGQMATGGGKTLTAAALIARAQARGARTLFVCDTLELVEQAVRAFDAYGLDVGVMQADHLRTRPEALVQVCSQSTLVGRLKYRPDRWAAHYPVSLVIHDEAHCQYAVRDRLADVYPDAVVIGLTATPFSKGMGEFYRAVVPAVSMQRLIDDGYLADMDVYAPSQPDMKGAATGSGDWTAGAAAAAYDGALVADIVQTWLKHGRGLRTLLFAANVAHSKRLVAEFQAAGVKAVHVDGYAEKDDDGGLRAERHATIAAYRAGEIDVLSSVTLCTKGFDAPETGCVVIARPTKSLSLHWQIVGRGLRPAPGKDRCVVLDHAGNFLRHGFPTDVTTFALHDGTRPEQKPDAREKGEKLPVPCPKCAFLKPPGCHACPKCAFAPTARDGVENVDGELVRLDRAPKKPVATTAEKQRWYGELRGYADAKGKSEKWVLAKYRAKFDVWPRGMDGVPPAEPSQATRDWLTSQAIAYAKSMQRGGRA